MPLFKRILTLIKPYWMHFALSILLTFFYIIFNAVSLWVSVDFIQEIFSPESTYVVQENQTVQPQEPGVKEPGDLSGLKERLNIYQQINKQLKSILIQENKFDTLKMICVMIFLSFLFKNIFGYLKRVVLAYIQLNIIVYLRTQLYNKLIRLPLQFYHKNVSGKLTSIAFNDVLSIHNVLSDSLYKLILAPLQIVFYLIMLVTISPRLSLITFTIIPVSAVLILKIGQSMRRKSRRVLQQISGVMAIFQEVIQSIRIVKAFNAEERENQKFVNENKTYFKYNFRAHRLKHATSPINETLGALILAALLWYGGNMVFSASTALEAEHFMRYLVFLFAMFQPLRELSGVNNTMQTGMAAAERIFDIIEQVPEVYVPENAKTLSTFSDKIEMDHISFQYEPEEPWVIQDVDLIIEKSQTVAFVGHSGSGKSTLMNLLPKYYDVNQGEIRIDGTNIQQLDLNSLRAQIGIVSQDVILFNDTIRGNIAYGNQAASDEDIVQAAKIANAWEFIEKMELGLDTPIGERGVRLSGGQKQRLSIARAVLKNPPIMILDEATSSLDTESERLVQEAIEKLMENRTVLVIAHRLSTVLHADNIVVLNNGKIEGMGPHKTLLKSCPLYKKLYEIQFNEEDIQSA